MANQRDRYPSRTERTPEQQQRDIADTRVRNAFLIRRSEIARKLQAQGRWREAGMLPQWDSGLGDAKAKVAALESRAQKHGIAPSAPNAASPLNAVGVQAADVSDRHAPRGPGPAPMPIYRHAPRGPGPAPMPIYSEDSIPNAASPLNKVTPVGAPKPGVIGPQPAPFSAANPPTAAQVDAMPNARFAPPRQLAQQSQPAAPAQDPHGVAYLNRLAGEFQKQNIARQQEAATGIPGDSRLKGDAYAKRAAESPLNQVATAPQPVAQAPVVTATAPGSRTIAGQYGSGSATGVTETGQAGTALAKGPSGGSNWQQDIVKQYPMIGVAGSPQNKAFVEAYKAAGLQGPGAMSLADKLAASHPAFKAIVSTGSAEDDTTGNAPSVPAPPPYGEPPKPQPVGVHGMDIAGNNQPTERYPRPASPSVIPSSVSYPGAIDTTPRPAPMSVGANLPKNHPGAIDTSTTPSNAINSMPGSAQKTTTNSLDTVAPQPASSSVPTQATGAIELDPLTKKMKKKGPLDTAFAIA